MASIFGYVHSSLDEQEIADAETRLAAAGASKIIVEPRARVRELGPASATPLKKQPALFDLLASASSGDAVMAVRLYHLAPAILRLLYVVDRLQDTDVALISLDDGIDTRQAGDGSVFPAFDALATLVEDYRARHGGTVIHIMEGNGGDGGGVPGGLP
jgi:DNA invertase Pin-like site-specific DNA recombinase